MSERCGSLLTSSLAKTNKLVLLWMAALLMGACLANAQGIGSYDFLSQSDLSFSFDYTGSGNADHLVAYRPGTGTIYILANDGRGSFTPVYQSGSGIGSFDLMSPNDRIIAFDYNGSGLSDHLLCYRPGTGVVFILQNMGGNFTPVYQSGSGLGSFDLMSTNDKIIAFDYNGSGLSDHLICYRPGAGTVFILENTGNNGSFTPVYESGSGIGSFDLMSTADLIVPFDYYSQGVSDHLVAYRPGTGNVYIIENTSGSFSPVYESSAGIGSYDLMSTADRLLPYDYAGFGNKDSLIAYRPGTGTIFILQSSYFNFAPIYQSGTGIGGYDLMDPLDQITTYDYNNTSIANYLALYRPGSGIFWIEWNNGGTFTPVYQNATFSLPGVRPMGAAPMDSISSLR